MIQKFPYEDPQNEKLQEHMERVRAKFRQVELSHYFFLSMHMSGQIASLGAWNKCITYMDSFFRIWLQILYLKTFFLFHSLLHIKFPKENLLFKNRLTFQLNAIRSNSLCSMLLFYKSHHLLRCICKAKT